MAVAPGCNCHSHHVLCWALADVEMNSGPIIPVPPPGPPVVMAMAMAAPAATASPAPATSPTPMPSSAASSAARRGFGRGGDGRGCGDAEEAGAPNTKHNNHSQTAQHFMRDLAGHSSCRSCHCRCLLATKATCSAQTLILYSACSSTIQNAIIFSVLRLTLLHIITVPKINNKVASRQFGKKLLRHGCKEDDRNDFFLSDRQLLPWPSTRRSVHDDDEAVLYSWNKCV
jgi:hypothetical protein